MGKIVIKAPKYGKLSDPTTNGEKVEELKKQHTKLLSGMGMHKPKDPT